MAFIIKKVINLSNLGDGWADCYISFQSPTFRQINAFSIDTKSDDTSRAIDFMKSLFIDGKAYDGSNIVDLKQDDLDDLPVEVIVRCMNDLSGAISPKVEEN